MWTSTGSPPARTYLAGWDQPKSLTSLAQRAALYPSNGTPRPWKSNCRICGDAFTFGHCLSRRRTAQAPH
eukprot:6817498-Lingulodinium_polyedra.AAC.1